MASRDAVPRPDDLLAPLASTGAEDLLASLGSAPSDLPAHRPEGARPTDLPASAGAFPRSENLPASAGAFPRSENLPASAGAFPRSENLPASAGAVPRTGNLPASRDTVPRPDDLLAPLDFGVPTRNLPASRDAIPRPGDLLTSRDGARSMNDAIDPPDMELPSLDLLPDPATIPQATLDPFAPPPPEDGRGLDLFSSAEMPRAGGAPLDPVEFGPSGTGAKIKRGEDHAGGSPDLGFSLEIEGAALPDTGETTTPFRAPRGSGEESVPQLTPHATRDGKRQEKKNTPAKAKKNFRKLALVMVGGMAVIAGGLFGWRLFEKARRAGPQPAELLEPMAGDLNKDHYPSYGKAAELLANAALDKPGAIHLRAAAAEQWLLGVTARGGDRGHIVRAEQVLNEIPPQAEPDPAIDRPRALLALAKGKGMEAERLLDRARETPEGQLIVGLRLLLDGKDNEAATAFRKVTAAQPERALGHYLLARALEKTKPPESAKSYKEVLSRNPNHFGATLALARQTESAENREISVRDLIAEKGATASPGEMSDAHLELGRAALTMGRSADAQAAFQRAVGLNSQNLDANLALGNLSLYEGRYDDALRQFRATGSAGLKRADGKFGMGGALIATGAAAQGLPHVHQAAAADPADPRGPFWIGFSLEVATPPDLEGAATQYRTSLSMDPKFLAGSLRLAALLQKQGKPQDALGILRDAEAAGAPATALQLAWGEALIGAKEPVRAEEVFRKALAESPKLLKAHLGIAAALEAQGNLKGAKEALEKTLVELPDAPGLRERLAAICVSAGLPKEAIAHLRAELATGHAPPSAVVATAKLGLELGDLDEAKSILEKLVADDPMVPDALFTLGRVWEARGDSARALSEYRRATRFDDKPEVQLALGRLLLRLGGREDDAMTALDRAASLPDALIERGRVHVRNGDFDRALADLKEAARLRPTDPQPWVLSGMAFDKMGRAEDAASAWRTAIRILPTVAEAQYNLGRFEMDHGRPKVAVDHLRQAAASAPPDASWIAELYFQLGYAELGAGSKSAAAKALKTYLELAPEDAPARPEVTRQIQRLGR